jgi:hypothetical protein
MADGNMRAQPIKAATRVAIAINIITRYAPRPLAK